MIGIVVRILLCCMLQSPFLSDPGTRSQADRLLERARENMAAGGVNKWRGANTAWDAAGNWSLGTIPVDDEHVVVDGQSQFDILTGLDQTGVQLRSFYTAPTYTGNIGDGGVFLEIDVAGTDDDWAVFEGPGSVYWKSATTADRGNYVVNSTNLVNALIMGASTSTSGNVSLDVKSGGVTVDPSMTHLDRLFLSGSNARVRLEDFGTSGTQNNVQITVVKAGRLVSFRSHPAGSSSVMVNNGGEITVESAAVASASQQLGLYIQTAGSMTWNADVVADTNSTIAAAFIFGGLLDMNATLDAKEIIALELHGSAVYKTGPHVNHSTYFHDFRGPGVPLELP